MTKEFTASIIKEEQNIRKISFFAHFFKHLTMTFLGSVFISHFNGISKNSNQIVCAIASSRSDFLPFFIAFVLLDIDATSSHHEEVSCG